MKSSTVLALFILVCLVGLFILLMERGSDPTSARLAGRATVLRIDPDRVRRLSVQGKDVQANLYRERGAWFFAQPSRARADAEQVERILHALEALPRNAVITAAERAVRGLSLADYGLSERAVQIGYRDAGGSQVLLVGAVSPLGDTLYVMEEGGDPVFATSTNLLGVIPARAEQLRDTRILFGQTALARRLEIKRADGFFQFVHTDGDWLIQKPIVARADQARVREILDRLFHLRVEAFVPEIMGPPVGLVPDEAVVQVNVWQEDEEVGERILFGGTVEGAPGSIYARGRMAGAVYTVKRDILDVLAARLDALRDRRLFPIRREAVRYIAVTRGDRRLELRRATDGAWSLTEPGKWPAESAAVAELLDTLTTAKILAFDDGIQTNETAWADTEAAGSIRVAAEALAFEGGADQPPRLLLDGDVPGRPALRARFEGAATGFAVNAGLRKCLSVDPLRYRALTVLALARSGIRRISVSRDGAEQAVARDAGGHWRPADDVPGTALTNAVDGLLGLAEELVALRYEAAAPGDVAGMGLGTNAGCLVTFGLTGADGIQKTLETGRPTRGGYYAMIRGQDAVFVLPAQIMQVLNRPLIQAPGP